MVIKYFVGQGYKQVDEDLVFRASGYLESPQEEKIDGIRTLTRDFKISKATAIVSEQGVGQYKIIISSVPDGGGTEVVHVDHSVTLPSLTKVDLNISVADIPANNVVSCSIRHLATTSAAAQDITITLTQGIG